MKIIMDKYLVGYRKNLSVDIPSAQGIFYEKIDYALADAFLQMLPKAISFEADLN